MFYSCEILCCYYWQKSNSILLWRFSYSVPFQAIKCICILLFPLYIVVFIVTGGVQLSCVRIKLCTQMLRFTGNAAYVKHAPDAEDKRWELVHTPENTKTTFHHEPSVTVSNNSVGSLLQSFLFKNCAVSAHDLFGCAVNSFTCSSSVSFQTE